MERLFYLDLDFWKKKSNKKPLVLKGARQVGKTYGVKSWGSKNYEKIVYLNFEKDKKLFLIFEDSLDPVQLIQKIENYYSIRIDLAKDLLFFDEAQLCGKALNSLKYFSEDLSQASVIAAGSLLGLVLNSEPFPVGKVQFLDIYPMCFREFLMAQNKANLLDEVINNPLGAAYLHEQLVLLIKHYLITGGTPESVQLYIEKSPKSAADFAVICSQQEDLVNAYIADMAKHCGKVNAMNLERLWRNIPEQLALKTEQTRRFQFKDVLPKKNKYSQMTDVFDWLESAGLIYRVPIANQGLSPLSAYAKESLFKLYLFDVGILNALSGLSPAEILRYDFGTFKGYLLENFVLQHLCFLFGKRNYSWSEGIAEVDFVREIDGAVIPIEVKSGINLKSKSLGQFLKKYSPNHAIRFSLNPPQLIPKSHQSSSKTKDWPLYLCGERQVYS